MKNLNTNNSLKIISLNTQDQNIWFTSDTHFWHSNIIEYTNRPFKDVLEMNQELIRRWNDKVKENDIIFHLGDFAHCGSDKLKELLSVLHGKKYLILGNHDWRTFKSNHSQWFEGIYQQLCIKINGRRVYLNHFPFLCYTGTFKGPENATYQLFGHVHSGILNTKFLDKPRLKYLFPYQYDVGVDNNNFTPISWDEVCEKINKNIEKVKTMVLIRKYERFNEEGKPKDPILVSETGPLEKSAALQSIQDNIEGYLENGYKLKIGPEGHLSVYREESTSITDHHIWYTLNEIT